MLGLFLRHKNNIRLTGPNLQIRQPRPADYKAWCSLRADSQDFLKQWEPKWASDALTKAGYKRRLTKFLDDWQAGTGCAFFIHRNSDKQLVGGITISNIRRGIVQSANIGYWIGEAYARQGYMTEALQLTLEYCFRVLSLHRIEAACLQHNQPSRKLLENNGFTEEGLARQYLCIDSKWQDHVTYAILRTDPRPVISVKEL